MELIMVTYNPPKLEMGMYLQKKRNGRLLKEYRTVTEQDIQIYPKMGFEWVPVEPYLIDESVEGGIDDLYAFLIVGRWTIAMFDEILGAGIKRVVPVVKEPNEIDINWLKNKIEIK
jgi:hypothetical protein